jgi:membrane protease subunit (stomatin/prohibitin family)
MRNKGAMLQDPSIREGFVQGSIAKGLEDAGSNAAGSMQGFLGVGMGMQGTGGFMGAAAQTNRYQMQEQAMQKQQEQAQQNQQTKGPSAEQWQCECGQTNTGRFCSECGTPKPQPQSNTWKCNCGQQNEGKFCGNCGAKRTETAKVLKCSQCGFTLPENTSMKFCPECGAKLE